MKKNDLADDELIRLHNIEKMLEATLNTVAGIHWWKDLKGVYRGCNQRMVETLGLQCKSDIIGKTDYELPWANQAADLVRNDNQVMRTGITQEGKEELVETPDGIIHTFMVAKAALYDHKGSIIGTVGNSIDITEQKHAKVLALKNKKQEKQLLSEKIMSQEKSKLNIVSRKDSITETVSGIAHEINQPLAAISAYLRGCLNHIKKLPSGYLPNAILTPIIKAEEQAQRAGEIIHSLKNLLSDNGYMSKVTSCDINKIIKKATNLERNFLHANTIKIKLKLYHKLPLIHCDETQIVQVIHNLIQNAVDAIVISNKSKKEISITSEVHDDNIIVTFKDSGTGIEKTNLQKVFLPFFTTKQEGTGIGLSLCYQIMQRHQGTITATSDSGQGTAFHLNFPLSNHTSSSVNLDNTINSN